jgi:hypothetical protein
MKYAKQESEEDQKYLREVVSCKSVFSDDSCFRSYGIGKRRAYALDLVKQKNRVEIKL